MSRGGDSAAVAQARAAVSTKSGTPWLRRSSRCQPSSSASAPRARARPREQRGQLREHFAAGPE